MLSSNDILDEKDKGNIVISPYVCENLGPNSYDVTLGEYFYRELEVNKQSTRDCPIYNIYSEQDVKKIWCLEQADSLGYKNCGIDYNGKNILPDNIFPGDKVIVLEPGERILAHTNEFIGGKNNITTMMKARSSMNRSFISVCLCAGLGDVGYINRWTFEITNHSRFHRIPLVVGRRIAQILFMKTGNVTSSYEKNGKYQESDDIKTIVENWNPESMLPKLYLDREIGDKRNN